MKKQYTSVVRAKNWTEGLGLVAIHASRVCLTGCSLAQENCVAVITERQLILWSKTRERTSVRAQILWPELTTLVIKEQVVQFGGIREHFAITFVDSDQGQFVAALSKTLSKVLTSLELSRLGLSMPRETIPSKFGCFARFLSGPREVDPSDVRLVRNMILFARRSFSVTEFARPELANIGFLRMLSMCSTLETLTLAEGSDADFEACNWNIRFLRRVGPVGLMPDFLNGLFFRGSGLTRDDLCKLRNYVIKKNMRAVAFDNALEPNELSILTKSFSMQGINPSLRSLTFSGKVNIDFQEFFNAFSFLHHLELEKCDCDVIEVLRFACAPGCNLRMLVLRGNRPGVGRLNFSIPDRLKAVVIDDLNGASSQFFRFLVHNLPAHSLLSMCNLRFAAAPWSEDLSFNKSRITNLRLDGHPIAPPFFEFLSACPSLTALSLSYCFGERDEEDIQSFGTFLRTASRLSRLTLRGNHVKYLGPKLPTLFPILQTLPQLRELDLSGHRSPAQGSQELQKFFLATRGHLSYIQERLTSKLSFAFCLFFGYSGEVDIKAELS
jgi:hypothetical protein